MTKLTEKTKLTELTEMTEMAIMTVMTEMSATNNNLFNSRTAERHARGQKSTKAKNEKFDKNSGIRRTKEYIKFKEFKIIKK